MYMTVLRASFESLRHREYIMDFDDGDFMHKWLTDQFDSSRAEKNILYRIDRRKDGVYLYVQSDDVFPERNIRRAGLEKRLSFEITVKDGDRIAFCLFGSSNTTGDDHKKVFIKDADARLAWVARKLGDSVSDLLVKEVKTDTVMVKGEQYVRGADYMGTCIVEDAGKFLDIVNHGIGRVKNYGMGLLLFKCV